MAGHAALTDGTWVRVEARKAAAGDPIAETFQWQGRRVTVRASRSGDAVTIRARADAEPFRLVRVVPLDPAADVEAGPFVCAPTRAGLVVRFLSWEVGPADAALH